MHIVKKRSKTKRVIPTWVKAISVIYFIYAFLYTLVGITIIVFGSFLLSEGLISQAGIPITNPTLLTGVGLFLAVLGGLYTFVGKDLWKGKNWARIAAITLSSAHGLFYLISLIYAIDFFAIAFIIIDVAILLYLLFNKDVKKVFS